MEAGLAPTCSSGFRRDGTACLSTVTYHTMKP